MGLGSVLPGRLTTWFRNPGHGEKLSKFLSGQRVAGGQHGNPGDFGESDISAG